MLASGSPQQNEPLPPQPPTNSTVILQRPTVTKGGDYKDAALRQYLKLSKLLSDEYFRVWGKQTLADMRSATIAQYHRQHAEIEELIRTGTHKRKERRLQYFFEQCGDDIESLLVTREEVVIPEGSQRFRFRADCLPDVDYFLSVAGDRVVLIAKVFFDPFGYVIEVDIHSQLSLSAIREILEPIEELSKHVLH